MLLNVVVKSYSAIKYFVKEENLCWQLVRVKDFQIA